MDKLSKLIEGLESDLESDLAWRKKEVSNLILLHDSGNELIVVKASILLIYAHWEGCIKNICKLYLKYVSDLKINLNLLALSFEAIQLKGTISEIQKSSESLTLSNELKLINLLYGVENKVFQVKKNLVSDDKDKSIINTKDNLSTRILASLLDVTGMNNKTSLEITEKYINQKLLNNRNKIAHGNVIEGFDTEFDIRLADVVLIKDLVFLIISTIKDDLLYHAQNKFYLHEHDNLKRSYDNSSNLELTENIKKLFE